VPQIPPDALKTLLHVVTAGNFPEVAARAAGLHPGQLHAWIDRGRREWDRMALLGLDHPAESEREYVELVGQLAEAEAASERSAVMVVRKAMRGEGLESGKPNAKPAMDFLKRRFPERWGDRIETVSRPRPQVTAAEARRYLAELLGVSVEELPAPVAVIEGEVVDG